MSDRPLLQHHATAPKTVTSNSQHLSTLLNSSSIQLWLVLNRLEIGIYFDRLLAHGFDNWITVLDIREEDFEQLSFKLGHRRKLQREIDASRNSHPLRGGGEESSSNSSTSFARSSNPKDTSNSASSTPAHRSEEYQSVIPSATKELRDDKMIIEDSSSTSTGHYAPLKDGLSDQVDRIGDSHPAVNLAIREASHLFEARDSNLEIFDRAHLPPYNATMLAMNAFLQGPGAFFFMWTKEEALATIMAVYSPDSESDSYVLLDLLAMCAVGTLCGCNCFTEALISSYYFSCLRLLGACAEGSRLCCMQVFSCLSYCTILGLPRSARHLNAAALEIGRAEIRKSELHGNGYVEPIRNWRRVFRSVILLESWFVGGFSFENLITEEDLIVGRSKFVCNTPIEDIIQEQASRVGCLALAISDRVRKSGVTSVEIIRHHMEGLNHWYWDLPSMMPLETLCGGCATSSSWSQKHSILLVHMQSLSAAAILHRPVLIAIAESEFNGNWNFDGTIDKYRVYEDYCVAAAREASRVAAILQNPPKHCWMTIFECSNACCILLFNASQMLFYDAPRGIETDFAYIQNFIEILAWCGTSEPIADTILERIKPIYEALKKMWRLRFPLREDDHCRHDEITLAGPGLPTNPTSPSAVSTIEPIFDNSSFANSDLGLILNQIIDLVLDPLNTVNATVLDQ